MLRLEKWGILYFAQQSSVRGAMMGILDHVWSVSAAQDRVWAQVSGLSVSRAHKRLLMVFQAFIDDSYKVDGVFVLAGHIATAETWAHFEKEWENMLPYGLRDERGWYFKMNEMTRTPERMERIGAFYKIIEEHEIVSISCKINIPDLRNAIKRLWSFGNKINWTVWEDPWFFTFRALLDSVHAHRHTLPRLPQNEKIDFIFDQQTQKKMIMPMWDEFLSTREEKVRNAFGATPRFEDDRDFMPLQAADLWAGWVRQWYEDGSPMQETENGPSMVVRGTFSASMNKKHHFHLISYGEELIVQSLKKILQENFPGVVIYDDGYKGVL